MLHFLQFSRPVLDARRSGARDRSADWWSSGRCIVVAMGILLLAGIFFGLTVVPLQTIPFADLSEDEVAQGTSLLTTVRLLGVATGTAAVALGLSTDLDRLSFVTAFLVATGLTLLAVPGIVSLRTLPSGT